MDKKRVKTNLKIKPKSKKEAKEEREEQKDKILKQLDGFRPRRTFGQKAADALTKWAGSWTFIILFFMFLIIWMLINGYFLIQYGKKPFDVYPYILLNLVLSCLAAIQAPIILMSQNRQAQRDRLKEEYDHRINKRAEEEIRQIKRLLIKWNKNAK
jgi:uncharacterized membrane protein